jgi:hypothetical protein
MSLEEMFDSSVRAAGDLAGVFEHDGETGYFYLYNTEGETAHRVIGSVRVVSGHPDFSEQDVSIRWDPTDRRVGLFIRGALWAVFDDRHVPHGGDYAAGAAPLLPSDANAWFGIAS